MIPKFDIRSIIQKAVPFTDSRLPLINNVLLNTTTKPTNNILRQDEQYYKCEIILSVEHWTRTQGGPEFGFVSKSQMRDNGDMFVQYVFKESDLPDKLKPFLYEEDTVFDQLDQYVVIFHPKICSYIKEKFIES